MMTFMDLLQNASTKNRSLLCVGLDPDLQKIPQKFRNLPKPIFSFNKSVIDATKDLVCAYKPQIAYYAAQAAEDELLETIQYIHSLPEKIPVILDSKRGDIGETAERYAQEAFVRYGADAVTVNPYMGGETLQPFLNYKDKGVIVLCKTSNPGSGDFQDLLISDQETLFDRVAKSATEKWNTANNVMLVVGGTHLQSMQKIRQRVGEMGLLVPGVGAQGGDLEQILKLGLNSKKRGLVINSSRGIIYATGSGEFESNVRQAALDLVNIMRKYI